MTAYIIITASLMGTAGIVSAISAAIGRDRSAAITRAAGEFALAAWGFYLVFK